MDGYAGFLLGIIFAAVLVLIGRVSEHRLLQRFRNITFYGPYRCESCGEMIVCSARESGRKAYDYPRALPYPNTEWQRHECVGDSIPPYTDFRGTGWMKPPEKWRSKTIDYLNSERKPQPPNCTDSGRS